MRAAPSVASARALVVGAKTSVAESCSHFACVIADERAAAAARGELRDPRGELGHVREHGRVREHVERFQAAELFLPRCMRLPRG